MLADEIDVVIGVDTHKYFHVAARVSPVGGVLDSVKVDATGLGYKQLYKFATANGTPRRVWAIEGTGSFGAGLTAFLQNRDEVVVEVERPGRPRPKRNAKTDELDAIRAARDVLSQQYLCQPRRRGNREAIRVLLATREAAVETRAKALCQLNHLIINAPETLRARLRDMTRGELIHTCVMMRRNERHSEEYNATVVSLRATARRFRDTNDEAKDLEEDLRKLLIVMAPPELLAEPGVGTVSAARFIAAWSHKERFRSEAAFASLAGVAPIPASSGLTVRNRLNRGGDRKLNRALHVVITNRLTYDERTKKYLAKRTAQGKSKAEVKRLLKRYLARHVFKILESWEPAA